MIFTVFIAHFLLKKPKTAISNLVTIHLMHSLLLVSEIISLYRKLLRKISEKDIDII